MKNREKTRQDIVGHQKYIEELHKQGTESYINSKVEKTSYFTKFDSENVKRFYEMLNRMNDDENHRHHGASHNKSGSSHRDLNSRFRSREK